MLLLTTIIAYYYDNILLCIAKFVILSSFHFLNALSLTVFVNTF